MAHLLSVENLAVEFSTEKGTVRAVHNVSLSVDRGETIGLVGESGCGKTVTALSLLRLVPIPPGRYAEGTIRFKGTNILDIPDAEMRKLRGREISMIFQEPMTALNPVFTVGTQMTDVLMRHQGISRADARHRAIERLKLVRIPAPERRIDEYPHQLSGGMRQRVMIAMALSCEPELLVADEPTTALDVTTQAQVMEQMAELQQRLGMSLILVTHDLGVIAETCKRVVVMYCGRIIEMAETEDLFYRPHHPYTVGLLHSIPRIREKKLDILPTIEGMVPDLMSLPKGCVFADRCPRVQERCRQESPPLEEKADGSQVACFYPVEA